MCNLGEKTKAPLRLKTLNSQTPNSKWLEHKMKSERIERRSRL